MFISHAKSIHTAQQLGIIGLAIYLTCNASFAAAEVWSTPPTLLASTKNINQTNENLGDQKVAINSKGQAVAAWVRGTQIQARSRSATTWSGVVTLVPAATGQTASLLDLTKSPLGDAIAVVSVNSVVQSSFFHAGTWSTPAVIPAATGAIVLNARVKYDSKTTPSATPTATLVWSEKTGASCAVKAATGNASTGWNNVITVADTGSACYNFIDLAINKRGEAALALGATPPPIRHAGSPAVVTSRNTSGTWTTLTNFASGAYGTAPSVAIADNGVAIAVFSDANLGAQWSRRSPADGSWTAKATFDGFVPAVPVKIAMASNGTAVAAYNTYYANVPPAPLNAATLPSGSNTWSIPVEITYPSGSVEAFNIAATPAGSFVVGWIDAQPAGSPGYNMGVSVLEAGNTNWSNTILDADMQGTYITPSPTAVAAASGQAIAIWNNNFFYSNLSNIYTKLMASTTAIK
ncbi:hypothetical protein Nit79A3_3157 [Nitrosomonas sp. Is79A3]|uniref:hypothetical protein n=1 Tax=Nitrosomonas sp. (strain Is79A3) TaxID=261292 RepID=UPI000215CCAC